MAPTRLIALAAVGIVAVSCGVVSAVESFFVSSEEAAQAATAVAEQTEDTLHALEHFLIFTLPAYFVGAVQAPLWGKWKKRKNAKKKAV